jgi:hypothetical protein
MIEDHGRTIYGALLAGVRSTPAEIKKYQALLKPTQLVWCLKI